MKKLLKKIVIKSYTREHYYKKLDQIDTRYMKESVHYEVKAFIRYSVSRAWLGFYTFFVDFMINTLLILGIALFKLSLAAAVYAFFLLINNFDKY